MSAASNGGIVPEGVVPLDECLAWIERYQSTSWNMLALSTATDKTHSPMAILGSLAWHAKELSRA